MEYPSNFMGQGSLLAQPDESGGPLAQQTPVLSPARPSGFEPREPDLHSREMPEGGDGWMDSVSLSGPVSPGEPLMFSAAPADNGAADAINESPEADNPPHTFTSLHSATATAAPPGIPGALKITVRDPHRHGEGPHAFISYSICTSTVLDTFSAPELAVRRRFQDVAWLHAALEAEFPAVVLPPLPDKHRLEYLTGDRFSAAFIERRRAALQRFVDRIAARPVLQRSEALRQFLENTDLRLRQSQSGHQRQSSNTALDSIADTVIHAFSRTKRTDRQFVDAREKLDKLERNVAQAAKFHGRALRLQEGLVEDCQELAQALSVLGAMEVPITGPTLEFVKTLRGFADELRGLVARTDVNFLGFLDEQESFAQSAKAVLRRRDEKQAEHEELVAFLEKTAAERAETARSGHGLGLKGFLRGKMDEIRGADVETKKQTRVERLDRKVDELQTAAQDAGAATEAFDRAVLAELDAFDAQRHAEAVSAMAELVSEHARFYDAVQQLWAGVIPELERITIVPDASRAQ